MQILAIVLIIYGLFCILIGIMKLPAIWNMKKLRIMAKMFKGEKNLQIFIIAWGVVALVVGLILR